MENPLSVQFHAFFAQLCSTPKDFAICHMTLQVSAMNWSICKQSMIPWGYCSIDMVRP